MTDRLKNRGRGKGLAAATSILALAYTLPAAAQTLQTGEIIPPQAPLNDADCDYNLPGQPREQPFCTVDGTRSVTYLGRQREVRSPTQDRIIDTYQVSFSGNLKVDGAPVVTGPNPVFPYGFPSSGPVDISNFLGTDGQTVNVDLNYVADRVQTVGTGQNGAPAATSPVGFSRFSSFNGTINSIAIDKSDYVVTQAGDGYNFVLKSLDPANVVNNSTALSGYFRSDDDNRAIQFGKLSGNAVVSGGGNILTPYPAGLGASNTGLLSLYRLTYNVTAQVTTTLDENGLVTPQVAVTDGIAMNGSRVTGLGAAVDGADAVNLTQLNTAIAAVQSPYVRITSTGANANASGTSAVAIGGDTLAGNSAVAVGDRASAGGLTDTAIGWRAIAYHDPADPFSGAGISATAIGASAFANGRETTAVGSSSVAMLTGASAFGDSAMASAFNATALGNNAQVQNRNAVALGANSVTNADNTVSVGSFGNERRITNVADGTQSRDAVNFGQLSAVATNANNAQARADDAHTRIDRLEAAGAGAVTSGGGTGSTASGTGSLAGGQNSTADGMGAIALGLGNVATGDGAVAIGDPNVATGTGAVAIGADNTATGVGAVALGNLSVATGDGAVALGNGATAGSAGSVALGGNASATGANSVALGTGSVADQANTLSVGAAGAERRVTNVAAGVGATDAANVAQVNAETAARTAADASLQAAIAAEAAARTTGDAATNTALAAEVVARQGADTQIVAAFNTEVTTRQQADLQLSQRIATQETASASLTANLAAEQAARIAADNATSARLASMDGRIGSLEARMDAFDDRVASATAVATAIGGNAFLPDMRFNITANVATYDGAHAGAFQIGAMVTSNVAVNAGVATGFNRGGKTAARAGVTFGF